MVSKISWRSVVGKSPFPFDTLNVSFWYSGQSAIWQGIRYLGLKKGDRVLAPAYSCGSEIDVLLKAGLVLDYYRILPNLSLDLEHLEALCKSPARAIFVTHYFGFPQPMGTLLALVKKHNLLLIEDNAHGLYSLDESGMPLGGWGDMGIFSLHKTLPIPDGGVLFLRDGPAKGGAVEIKVPSKFFTVGRKIFVMAVQEIVFRLPKFVYRTILRARIEKDGREQAENEENELRVDRVHWKMSKIAEWIVGRIDHDYVRDHRRKNFKAIEKKFQRGPNVRPLMGALPEGCCPWFYPVWAENANGLEHYLISNGVGCGRFWVSVHPDIPTLDFPFEASLKQHVVVLPIHQDLNERDMTLLVELLDRWNKDDV